MRPRIFSLMLTAFTLVIVLGIGGTATIFSLALVVVDNLQQQFTGPDSDVAREADRLGAYYAAQGNWQGAQPRFQFANGVNAALVDENGVVIGGMLPGIEPMVGPRRGLHAVVRRMPIYADGVEVGQLLITSWTDGGRPTALFDETRIISGMAAAGAGLLTILLGIAAVFSRQISRPLLQVGQAAEGLARGDRAARAAPVRIRELSGLAESFNRMAEALQAADEQRRQMTADIAHELRTPLTVVKGRLEGIQDGIYQADNEQLDGLLQEVALLERLIDDLRLLALADAGQLRLELSETAPADLLCEAARSFTPLVLERGVTLQVEQQSGLPLLRIDTQRMMQVIGNLLANALRHTPAGGSVTLRALQHNGLIRLQVADTGSGIAPADLPHVFERFYRSDRARTRSSGGAGLGLAIARRLVEAHGGTISVASQPGHGTEFTIDLPSNAAPARHS
jgi:signal transduction histidine kinase